MRKCSKIHLYFSSEKSSFWLDLSLKTNVMVCNGIIPALLIPNDAER